MSATIAVCLKRVYLSSVPVRLEGSGRAIRAEEAPAAANPADLAALALALGLAGGAEPARVLALTVGPPAWEEPLRLALAAGPPGRVEALRVWNPDWPEERWSGALDGSAAHTAFVASAAAESLIGSLTAATAGSMAGAMAPGPPALVLAGEASADGGHGCFGAFLAHGLGAAYAHRAVALAREGVGWRVRVKLERGYTQEMTLPAPAVVTVSPALPPPPYPGLPAWMAARAAAIRSERSALPYPSGPQTALRAPVPRVKRYRVPDSSLDAEGRIRNLVDQPLAGGGVLLQAEEGAEAGVENAAEAILKLLREKGYIES